MSGRIPSNAVLLFEVELKKIKLSKERQAEQELPRWGRGLIVGWERLVVLYVRTYVYVYEIMFIRYGRTCKNMVGIVNMCYDGNIVNNCCWATGTRLLPFLWGLSVAATAA